MLRQINGLMIGGAASGAGAGGGDMKRSHSVDTFLLDAPMVLAFDSTL